jgi:hypothetical protein
MLPHRAFPVKGACLGEGIGLDEHFTDFVKRPAGAILNPVETIGVGEFNEEVGYVLRDAGFFEANVVVKMAPDGLLKKAAQRTLPTNIRIKNHAIEPSWLSWP